MSNGLKLLVSMTEFSASGPTVIIIGCSIVTRCTRFFESQIIHFRFFLCWRLDRRLISYEIYKDNTSFTTSRIDFCFFFPYKYSISSVYTIGICIFSTKMFSRYSFSRGAYFVLFVLSVYTCYKLRTNG